MFTHNKFQEEMEWVITGVGLNKSQKKRKGAIESVIEKF